VDVSNVLAGAKSTILQNWAMTRYDVVAHSQGGVLSRMLSSQNPNGRINAPFRNEDNFFRGRFHRVVTIGSPHNGSRILRFLLALTTAKCESLVTSNHVNLYHANNPLGALVASAAVYAQVAQAKFDPFGDQIKDLNNSSTSGNWYPDPAAQFHLVRAVTDGGKSPVIGDATLAYQVLDLVYPGGGETVIPRGSDGVVDYDSMAANVPEAPLAPNVYDMPPSLAICRAAPLSCFGATVNETASTAIAQHVINALDQNGQEPASNTQFGSFPLPPLVGDDVRQAIDTFACSLFQTTELQAIAQDSTGMDERPHPLDGQLNFYYFHINFPSNEPPSGNVTWFAMVYGTNGVTQGGVTCTAGGTNDSQVTVTVDSGLIGDVVLFAFYLNTSNQMVQATGQLVTSQGPSGTFPVGIGILPWDPSMPAGSVLPIQLATIYGDGNSSMRYVTEGSLAATSSDPSVVSVTDPLNWQLLSPGNAQVVVTWSGFSATNQVNVFLSTSESPQLSIARSGGSLLLGWPLWASDFTLTSNTSLAGPNWQSVKTLPVTNGQQLNLTLPPAGSPSFFRLQR